MRARADAKAETRTRILLAVRGLAEETLNLDPTLDEIAARAGVSVQTLLRHFGNRDGLLDAAVNSANAEIVAERETPPGDIPTALRVLVDHYELRGDFVLRMLGREHDDPRMAKVVGPGRRLHREWVASVFGPFLPSRGAARAEALDLLVVATDVYVWTLLRRDRGLSRAETQARMHRLVDAVLGTIVPENPSDESDPIERH